MKLKEQQECQDKFNQKMEYLNEEAKNLSEIKF